MDNEILFSERQRFKRWWVWIILVGLNSLFLFFIYYQVVVGKQFIYITMSNSFLFFNFGIFLSLFILCLILKLEIQIRRNGIYIRFFPFHLIFRYYPWEKISKLFIRQYNPIGEFDDWALKHGVVGKVKVYGFSRKEGLQIEFTDNKLLLIGTNKPDELMDSIKSLCEINCKTIN